MDGVEADEIETQFGELTVVKTFRKDRTRKLGAAKSVWPGVGDLSFADVTIAVGDGDFQSCRAHPA